MVHPTEKVNPTQLSLAISDSPPKVRAWGLREAHAFPLVGVRNDGGAGRIVRTLRMAQAQAWGYPDVGYPRSASAYCAACRGCGRPRQAPRNVTGGRCIRSCRIGLYSTAETTTPTSCYPLAASRSRTSRI